MSASDVGNPVSQTFRLTVDERRPAPPANTLDSLANELDQRLGLYDYGNLYLN